MKITNHSQFILIIIGLYTALFIVKSFDNAVITIIVSSIVGVLLITTVISWIVFAVKKKHKIKVDDNRLEEKARSSKILYWIVPILAVLILGASFYWTQWRPNKIRKDCAQYPDTTATSVTTHEKSIWGGPGEYKETTNLYIDCLHKNGLK